MGIQQYVEIPIFFIMLSVCIQGPVFTNLIIFRTCYVDLKYNVSECALLGSENKDNYTQALEKLVEPHSNIISMVLSLPSNIICAVAALLIGSWSDKFGRKPIMVATIIGQTVSFGFILLYCMLPNLSAWYLIFTTIPVILSGGFASALTIFLSYITDITDEHNRGVRMGILEATISVGMLIGTVSSSYIFNAAGYTGVLCVCLSCYVIALLYTVYVIQESLLVRETEGKVKAFFDMDQIKEMGVMTFKTRPNHKRTLILLCLAITSLFIFVIMSAGGFNYLFLRAKFGWSLKQYTLYSSAADLMSIFGTFLGVYGLHKLLKVEESIVVLMGLSSCMDGYLVNGLATASIHIYFGGAFRFLTGNVSPMLRSLISKVAEPHEVGKIFSVLIMCENVLQLLGPPVYTYVYNNTLDTQPGFYNFLSAGLIGVTIILTLIVTLLHQMIPGEPEFTSLNNESASESTEILPTEDI